MSELTVVDVHGIAADIGEELKKLIEDYGSESVTDLMPLIIRVLEQLESCVRNLETRSGESEEGKERIIVLMNENAKKTAEIARLKGEVNKVEQAWREESRELLEEITELQSENETFKCILKERDGVADRQKLAERQEIQMITKLKEAVDRQRDQLRAKDNEIQQRLQDTDALQQQVARLAKVNQQLRRKSELLASQAKSVIKEKTEMQTKLEALAQDMGRHGIEIETMQQNIVPEEMNGSSFDECEGKIIIDPKDPNRPRFTLKELQTVLQERDELKFRTMELEDELQGYRPSEDPYILATEQVTPPKRHEDSGIRKLLNCRRTLIQTETVSKFTNFFQLIFSPKSSKAAKPSNPSARRASGSETNNNTVDTDSRMRELSELSEGSTNTGTHNISKSDWEIVNFDIDDANEIKEDHFAEPSPESSADFTNIKADVSEEQASSSIALAITVDDERHRVKQNEGTNQGQEKEQRVKVI
ncbi:RILP-like protein 1 isoform X2 [Anneissia japonica]|uniref:RILP-like protein 1 isoform X2 n=1 Tax=Anneissia japonica TaxID=1529436 RepID=UPI0014255466|nr:RILP-like protein 1 isoform X2 [Anneissia japonica]